MIGLSLVRAEVLRRPGRTISGALSLGVGLALFLGLQAYGSGYRAAAREPLTQIGTDVVAQREGDRPESFEGVVFPHSTAPIHQDEVRRMAAVPGVEQVAQAMFFWSFQDRDLVVALGVDAGADVGPGRLRAGVRSGRFLEAGDTAVAVLDASFARQKGLAVGASLPIAGQPYAVVGIVDTTRAGQVANANVYVPLADAQRMAAASPAVQRVHDIGPTDVNVVFVRANPARIETVSRGLAAVLGSDALVTTPESFNQVLGSTFGLIDRFGLLIGVCALLVAGAGLLRSVLANLVERRKDVAVLRAIGWPRRYLTTELVTETAAIGLLGLLIGIGGALALTAVLRQTNVVVPIPWELSPTPHFLPGGARQLSVVVPLRASLELATLIAAVIVSITAAGLVGALAARRAARIKPTEVWRDA